jgi:hypothetical protein
MEVLFARGGFLPIGGTDTLCKGAFLTIESKIGAKVAGIDRRLVYPIDIHTH